MDKDQLLDMADNPELLPCIYNYCDRWCERCTFNLRCLQFTMDQEELASDEQAEGFLNSAFWKKMGATCRLTLDVVQEIAHRDGIDHDSLISDKEMLAVRRNREIASNHECSRAAMAYAAMVDAWFGSANGALQEKMDELQARASLGLPDVTPIHEVGEIKDSEVIRWYQHFINAKVIRALEGKLRGVLPNLKGMPRDFDGSAKIALIAIDRSIGAWGQLQKYFPHKQDGILELLIHLERLRRGTEHAFPDARSFVRPGFD